jgi:flagellin
MDESGTTFSIHKALLGVSLLVGLTGTQTATAIGTADTAENAAADYDDNSAVAPGLIRHAGTTGTDEANLEDTGGADHFTVAAFTQALENIATLRATNGGQVRRLQYQLSNVETQITNIGAANGRIVDVDIAAESSNLARQQVLVQASAAMTAQANTSNDVALMLLR